MAIITALMLLCGCKSGVRNPSAAGDLDAYFRSVFSPDEPGAAVLVAKGDSILWSAGYGLADVKSGEPVTPATLFNLGSISKTFVANAILLLDEERKLSLEDSLIRYFPDFRNTEIAQKVKIKHLLNHTSGLPDNRKVKEDTTFYLTAGDAGNWYPETQVTSLLFDPGSGFRYSNPAYNGLAIIVEKAAGVKWQKFVEERIMRPSGMTRSTITDGPHPQSGVSHGYVKVNDRWVEDDYGEEPTFPAAGNGGVWSSAEELLRYEKALRESIFLKPATVRGSRTPQYFANWASERPEHPGWSWFKPVVGWSWFINTRADSLSLIGHTGTQGGFIANYVSIPEKEIFFVILCNAPRDIHAMSDRIMDWLERAHLLD